MRKSFTVLLATVLAALPGLALAQSAKPELDAQVHCAVIFGLIARDQNNSRPGADRFPKMDEPGKAFFVATGMRMLEEQKIVIDQLEPFFTARISEVDSSLGKGADRAKGLDAEYAKCVPLIAQVVPDAATLVK